MNAYQICKTAPMLYASVAAFAPDDRVNIEAQPFGEAGLKWKSCVVAEDRGYASAS